MAPRNILLTGPTGFIGKRLLYALDEKGYHIRCLVRPGETLNLPIPLRREPEIVYADLLDPDSLPEALHDMDAAYYLVHSMGGRSIRQTLAFAEKDRRAALNFRQAADQAGLSRIIYLGGGWGMRRTACPIIWPAAMRWPAFFRPEK